MGAVDGELDSLGKEVEVEVEVVEGCGRWKWDQRFRT